MLTLQMMSGFQQQTRKQSQDSFNRTGTQITSDYDKDSHAYSVWQQNCGTLQQTDQVTVQNS